MTIIQNYLPVVASLIYLIIEDNSIRLQCLTNLQNNYCYFILFCIGEVVIKGVSVVEWLGSLISNHLRLTAEGSNPANTLKSFMWPSYPANSVNVGCSTRSAKVPARRCTRDLPSPGNIENKTLYDLVSVIDT